jgi:hypothetical protein
MKRLILLLTLVFIFTFPEFAQITDKISEVPPINRGKIILTDGTLIFFTNLTVIKDSVSALNSHSIMFSYHKDIIYRISKTGNCFIEGAVTGGLGALIGGILGASDWDKYPDLKEKKTSFIVGVTIGSAVIGGIVGACIKKDKIVYRSSRPLSFNPGINFIEKNKIAFLVTCKFNINIK